MAITFRGVTATPSDLSALSDATGVITLDKDADVFAAAVPGDLIIVLLAHRDGAPVLTVGVDGGQSWSTFAMYSPGSSSSGQVFWCRFNGTWDVDPAFNTTGTGGNAITAVAVVFTPSSALNTWAVDVTQSNGNAVPTTPFDVTATGHTVLTVPSVTFAYWFNTNSTGGQWALQTAGWNNPNGETQWRNTQGTDLSVSAAYKINTATGSTGNVANRQVTATGIASYWGVITFKEVHVPSRRTLLGVG